MNAPIPTLDSWPEQSIRGHSILGSRYTSRDFMEQEWEGMWTRVWLLLGRESELPEPGDWQMEPVGREEILMVRQQDGSIKAFYNVCQHRGNPLVDDPKAATHGALSAATTAGPFYLTACCSSRPTRKTSLKGTPAASCGSQSSSARPLPASSG